jgi:hypothetical protein
VQTLRQIGFIALNRLFNSSRFRSSDPAVDHRVTFSDVDFDLEKRFFEEYERDHDTGYRAGTNYMIWGIELGLFTLSVFEPGYEFHDAIIRNVVTTSGSALPSHVIVHSWSNSDYSEPSNHLTIYRLSAKQDELLQQLRDLQPAPNMQVLL